MLPENTSGRTESSRLLCPFELAFDRTSSRTKVTTTMTTLIEDVSNKWKVPGPAGMSDGVMTHRKNNGYLMER